MAVYAYGRVSTDRQENGREGQLKRLMEAAVSEDVQFDEVFLDEDVSGSTPFNKRKSGKVLWDLLKPGDCVYITKVDRGFRSMSDAAFTLEKWKQLGIRVRIVDLGIDVSTPAGEMFFHLLAAFATFERQMIASRTREAIAYRTGQRGIHKNARPIGWQRVPSGDRDWKLVENPREREIAAEAKRLREAGYGWQRVVVAVWRSGMKKPTGTHYDKRDLARLIAAADAGYPKTPQVSLRASARAAKPAALSAPPRQQAP